MKKFIYILIIINCTLLIPSARYCYSQWVTQNSGTTQHLYDVYFIDTQTGWACGDNGTILKTTNGGNNWFGQTSSVITQLRTIHFVDSNIGYCSGGGGGYIQKTTNGGSNWFLIFYTPYNGIQSIYFIDSLTGWASGTSGGAWVFRTTNGGASWDSVMVLSGATGYYVYFIDSQTGWLSAGWSMYKSTDGGVNWSFLQTMAGDGDIAQFSFVNQNTGWLLKLETYRVYNTTNGGNNWTFMAQLPDCFNAHSIYFSSLNTGWVSGDCSYMFKTTDGGANWLQQNVNVSAFLNSVVFLTDSIGWSVGQNGTIIHTTTGGEYLNGITEKNTVPDDFKLFTNYPNPFNNITRLKFQMPKTSFIKLVIYDILGRVAVTLIDKKLQHGTYEIQWDASNYPSGMYLYSLIADGYRATEKMIFVK